MQTSCRKPALKSSFSLSPSTAAVVFGSLLAASSALLFQAPASASTYTFTINGFQDAFAGAEWTGTPVLGGTGSINATAMELKGSATAGSSYSYEFDTTKIDTLVPLPAGYEFESGTVTFDWNWSSGGTNIPPFSPFSYQVNNGAVVQLPTLKTGGNEFDVNDYVLAGTGRSFAVSAGDTFTFSMQNLLANRPAGTAGTITNFSFTGIARAVPGPLPVLAGLAGFAWSRKLRRRLISHRQQLG